MMSNPTKSFNILVTCSLNVLHNYYDNPTKLFSDLYQANFLISATPFSLCCYVEKNKITNRQKVFKNYSFSCHRFVICTVVNLAIF